MKHEEKVKSFGRHVRRLREQKGWSQQALADEADIAKTTLQRIELAKHAASLDVIISLSEALEVPLEELMRFNLP